MQRLNEGCVGIAVEVDVRIDVAAGIDFDESVVVVG